MWENVDRQEPEDDDGDEEPLHQSEAGGDDLPEQGPAFQHRAGGLGSQEH